MPRLAPMDGRVMRFVPLAVRLSDRLFTSVVGHLQFSPAMDDTTAVAKAMAFKMGHALGLVYRRYEWTRDTENLASRRLGFSFESIFSSASGALEAQRDPALSISAL